MDGDFLDLPKVNTPIPWPGRAARESADHTRRLIAEAERACRFIEGLDEGAASYRARELRAEIAAARKAGL